MIEISVVLPQPDGPTSSVISPAGSSRSMPRRAIVRVSPESNSLVRPRQTTAKSVMVAVNMVFSLSNKERRRDTFPVFPLGA